MAYHTGVDDTLTIDAAGSSKLGHNTTLQSGWILGQFSFFEFPLTDSLHSHIGFR